MKLAAGGARGMSSLDKAFRWGGAAAVWACWYGLAWGADPSAAAPRWRTGVEFQRALDGRVTDVVWSTGTPLRQALTTVARTQGIALMLDRRIDPGSAIELSVRDVTVREIIEQLAAQCNAAPTYLDGVVYVGPRALTTHLATVAGERRAEARQMPRPVAERLAARRAWRWDELAEPRALIADVAREAGVRLEGAEQVPHDLWPALELPPLAWTDRMTLVLAGFGMTFTLADSGASARLTPLPAPDRMARTYGAILSSSQLDAVKALFPQATIDQRANRVEFSGTAEEHDRLQQLLERQTAARPSRRPADETVLTLKVTSQPVDAILKTLERQLGTKFQIPAGLAESLRTRVSFDVREVPLSELLDAALTPAGLAHRNQGDTIVIQRRGR